VAVLLQILKVLHPSSSISAFYPSIEELTPFVAEAFLLAS
jgi:hypothetical protein